MDYKLVLDFYRIISTVTNCIFIAPSVMFPPSRCKSGYVAEGSRWVGILIDSPKKNVATRIIPNPKFQEVVRNSFARSCVYVYLNIYEK